MLKKLSLFLLGTIIYQGAAAQTTYLQLGNEDYPFIDRMETRSGELSNDFFTTVKPIQRKGLVHFMESLRSPIKNAISEEETDNTATTIDYDYAPQLTAIDRYNIDHAISVSGEWAYDGNGAIRSRKPLLKHFYKTQPDFVYVNTDNFFLSVNPVISLQGAYEKDNDNNPLFNSGRGIEARGLIARKLGFYTYFTDNQERVPSFYNAYILKQKAVPGADYYQIPSLGKYDYLLARGYLDFAAIKDHLNITFGYDKHFWGDGMRSLFISDFAAASPFLRLNTRIWKLNYQNLFLELTPQYKRGADRVLPKKYATMHHLSVNATKWLNIGVFEGIVFNRPDHFEFSYLVPVIFYRQVERANGSPDNALLGLNFKAIALKHVQLYGQFVLDEFKVKELTAGNGWWANKFGLQLGAKYFDAFGLPNLDLQGEVNIVRPFTYTHNDTNANFTHYNQPLAHPLGAGFAELIGVVRYQPVRNLYLTLKGTYYNRGTDPNDSTNLGNNIFLPSTTREDNYGYELISGIKTKCAIVNLNASYELRENLFLDAGITHRKYNYETTFPDQSTTYFYGGFRLNIARRDYDQF